MEVHHKPHPFHSWRELAKEIGVIMVGVLLALGAEQVVEAIHWADEVETQRATLLSEARDNLTAVAYRGMLQPCIDARLQQLAEVFRRHARGEQVAVKAATLRPPFFTSATSSWDVAVAGQALGHMPEKERLAFSDAFDAYQGFARLRQEEDQIWQRLALIQHADFLDANDWSRLHEEFGEAEGMSARMRTLMQYIQGPASLHQHGGAQDPLDLGRLKTFCQPLSS